MAEDGPGGRGFSWAAIVAVFAIGRLALEFGGDLGRLAGEAAGALLDLPGDLQAAIAGLLAEAAAVSVGSPRLLAALLAVTLIGLAWTAARRL